MINQNLIYEILLYVLIISTIIQMFYWLFFYIRVAIQKPQNTTKNLPPVSIIIAARNEEKNLKRNLKYFLEQDYPDFTVIVVNDASTDNSATVLAQLKLKYPNLYVTNIPYDAVYDHGKKTALTIGIKAAKTEILLFSDADCRPASKNWIKKMVEKFDKDTDFVIGFGAYEQRRGLLDKLIRSDTLYIAMQYLSFALAGIPYMAVGRNMAYKKSVFIRNKGFAPYTHLLSGSDDLFVNQNANKKNTAVTIDHESFTISHPETKLKKWIRQKTRHYTTARYYKFKHKFLLATEPLTRILFYLSSIILLIFNFSYIVLSISVLRIILIFIILLSISKKLNQKKLFPWILVYDLVQPIINLVLYLSSDEKKETVWK